MIFQYEYKFDLRKILKTANLKRLNILDFGCGIGNWNLKDINSNQIKKITFYDKNKELINFLRSKYKSKKVNIDFDYKNIVKNNLFNLIIFSSVIQYIPQEKLKKIISEFTEEKSKLVIIITDIPYLPRFLEFLFLPFLNFKRFFFTLNLVFSKKYNKIDYFTYEKKYFNKFKKKFSLKYIHNLHDLKMLRYSVIMTLK